MIGTFVYWALMKIYYLAILLSSIFNPKARLWIKGRKKLFSHIKSSLNDDNHKKIWVHCSSLGEFEQARPVIESIKEKLPKYKIILTFFSPSGYEIRKNYNLVDWVFYLALDSPKNAKRLIKLFKPSLVLFVKYDFWYFILRELNRKKIKVILFSAIFQSNQLFFKKIIGNWYRRLLFFFNHIFVQDNQSFVLLKQIGIKNIEVIGDTRFDRVVKIAQNFEPLPLIEKFVSEKTIVAGSTWEEDDKILAEYINTNKDVRLIIAPHEVNNKSINRLTKLFKNNFILYTDLVNDKKQSNKAQVIIINTIGLLKKLYYYATITYVGGGFKHGIHNLLEAIVYGKPVVFGPNHQKFKEAHDLLNLKIGFCINDEIKATKIFNELLNNKQKLEEISQKALEYVYKNTGATDKIMNWILKKHLSVLF